MTKINFDEPSLGKMRVQRENGLEVNVSGKGSQGILGFAAGREPAGDPPEQPLGGTGVVGVSEREKGIGVWGESRHSRSGGAGVIGICRGPWAGVQGVIEKAGGMAVFAECRVPNTIGILARAISDPFGPGLAGRFEGRVEVDGHVTATNYRVWSNDFGTLDSELENVESGTIVVLTENRSLRSSYQEYDKKVAGIISDSRDEPSIDFDKQQVKQGQDQKEKIKKGLPMAIMGRVNCKVDATHASIEIGDLLTTSSTKGHAMKAQDPMRSFGAVIGKALDSLKEGTGVIPVLVTLH